MKNAILCVAALALALTAAPLAAREPIRIGWTAWADGVFVTRLAARVIETELDQPVELVRAGIAEQYQGIASGRLDAMLMSWQPRTHGPYIRRVADRVEHLGALYTGGRLGWAVPEYVPRDAIASIADLDHAEVRDRLDGRITGIEPASGLMRLSYRAVDAYGLDGYTLEPGGGPAMAQALTRAIDANEWIVVTAWSPHWMFAAFDLRYLEDERGILGGSERVHALARPGFHADHPAVAELLGRIWLPRAELESALLDAHEDSTSAAVDRYLEAHPDRIAYWVSGDH